MDDLNTLNKEGMTLLMLASVKGDAKEVARLLNEGANPLIKGSHGLTAKMRANNKGFKEVVRLLEVAELDTIKSNEILESNKPDSSNSSKPKISKQKESVTYKAPEASQSSNNTNYGAAILYTNITVFLGWLLIVIGVISAVIILFNSRGNIFLNMVPGLSIAIVGFGFLLIAQFIRATLDNADHTRKILNILEREK